MAGKAKRQRTILELLARNTIDSQEQLQALLSVEGVSSTQATLSRDLRELGAVKVDGGYHLPRSPASGADPWTRFRAELGPLLRSVDVGGNIVVLRTDDEARARELVRRFEQADLHQVAGALAGGGTVLVVTRSTAQARELAKRLTVRR